MSQEGYFYNQNTGEVEFGKKSAWDSRIGPFETAEEARNALEKISERNKEYDAEEDA